MGCFSFKCKKCNRPINSDSSRGQRVILFLLKNGEVIEKMQGEYDSYGRVFDEQGNSIKWSIEWSDVCELMFNDNNSNGICAYHEKCYKRNNPVVTRSTDDPNQGWGRFKLPPVPFKGLRGHNIKMESNMRHQFERDLEKIKDLLKDEGIAKELYNALCNMQWVNIEDSTKIYSCSWRYAGGIVAILRNQGESYLDFYCSGNEGHVSPHIKTILGEIGWVQYPYEEDE